jgi:hypothetical protein
MSLHRRTPIGNRVSNNSIYPNIAHYKSPKHRAQSANKKSFYAKDKALTLRFPHLKRLALLYSSTELTHSSCLHRVTKRFSRTLLIASRTATAEKLFN